MLFTYIWKRVATIFDENITITFTKWFFFAVYQRKNLFMPCVLIGGSHIVKIPIGKNLLWKIFIGKSFRSSPKLQQILHSYSWSISRKCRNKQQPTINGNPMSIEFDWSCEKKMGIHVFTSKKKQRHCMKHLPKGIQWPITPWYKKC